MKQTSFFIESREK